MDKNFQIKASYDQKPLCMGHGGALFPAQLTLEAKVGLARVVQEAAPSVPVSALPALWRMLFASKSHFHLASRGERSWGTGLVSCILCLGAGGSASNPAHCQCCWGAAEDGSGTWVRVPGCTLAQPFLLE